MFVVLLTSCERPSLLSDVPEVEVREMRRMKTDFVCPLHHSTVWKMETGGGTYCYASDPLFGMTIEEAKEKFPYAVCDANYYFRDDSSSAPFPRYFLVCEKCQEEWRSFVEAQPTDSPHIRGRVEFVIDTEGKVFHKGVEVSEEDIKMIARAAKGEFPGSRAKIQVDEDGEQAVIRAVVEACKRGGISEFLFGSFETSR